MSGCLPLLPLYAFMAWTDIPLPLPSIPLGLLRRYSLCHFIVSILSLYLSRKATVQLVTAIKHWVKSTLLCILAFRLLK